MGGEFLSLEFKVRARGGSRSCELLTPIYFRSSEGVLYEAPVGTPTDFASTPPIIWGLPLFLIPAGWWALAAVVHDAAFKNLLYRLDPDGTRYKAFPRQTDEQNCNDLMFEMMKCLKPKPTWFEWLQGRAIYFGVTLFGWHAFSHDRET